MFAKSEILNEGAVNKPLFAKQVPPPTTMRATAKADFAQYEVLILSDDGKVAPLTPSTASGGVLAIAAYPAKDTDVVEVYVEGHFNVNALVFDKYTEITKDDLQAAATKLNGLAEKQSIYFEVLAIDPVYPV